ncbi:hypothetical protein IGI04_018685 [Brassica rapa subsp. trilocularis]|uniref:Uncharacterized protein n=1 Tax=Brassica rapa subsp. trilocularis TaxID=1813537 RepID=A0ABQ7MDN0_BRACM|nr:hypothetical protein IGI04_018685 [Brassica rapa subsp. trilocularis]
MEEEESKVAVGGGGGSSGKEEVLNLDGIEWVDLFNREMTNASDMKVAEDRFKSLRSFGEFTQTSCGDAAEAAERDDRRSESGVAGFEADGYSIPVTAENSGGEQVCSHASSETSTAEQQFHP